MSDIAFNPVLSTNEVFRANNRSQFLSNDLDAIEADIQALETGKADSDHTHADYAAANHNHNSDYIARALQMVSDTGDVKYILTKTSGKNLITELESMPIGMHTIYSQSGVPGNPKTFEAWRLLVHKTTNIIGWVIGFGSMSSVYVNYRDDNGWRGWSALYDASPAELWKHPSGGGYYMGENQVVTPSKTLSECRNGWVLIWSDYDADTSTVNDSDEYCTYIYKKNAACANWSGQGYLCLVPTYANDTGDLNNIAIKSLAVHNSKLVGKAKNSAGANRRDVVLRAVYEF